MKVAKRHAYWVVEWEGQFPDPPYSWHNCFRLYETEAVARPFHDNLFKFGDTTRNRRIRPLDYADEKGEG